MAEFQEVMKQRKRMCGIFNCADCPLSHNNNGISGVFCNEFIRDYPAEAEAVIMKWAAKHPEPVYPSWNEAWKQLFPDSWVVKNGTPKAPCLKYFLPNYECHNWKYPKNCSDCLKQSTPADVAKKLGIKPINQ